MLISELNLVGSAAAFHNQPDRASWLQRVCDEFDAVDAYRRPRAVQFSHDHCAIDPVIADLPGIALVLGNAYRQSGSLIPFILGTSQHVVSARKPNMIVEFGGSWAGTTPARMHADLHTALWSNAMTTSPGAPMTWWFDIVDRRGLYGEYAALNRYMAGEDRRGWKLSTSEQAALSGPGAEQLATVALAGEDRARVWVYDLRHVDLLPKAGQEPVHSGTSLALPGLAPGRYRIGVWNTQTGLETSTFETEAMGGTLTVPLPDFAPDCALKIDPTPQR